MQLLWASARLLNGHAPENLVSCSTLKQTPSREEGVCFTVSLLKHLQWPNWVHISCKFVGLPTG